jgi:hypothetical protein
MDELSREDVIVLSEKAGFGMNEIRKDIVKFERLAWLVQRVCEEESNEILPRVQ